MPARQGSSSDRMSLTELAAQVRLNGKRLKKVDPKLWLVVEHLLEAIEEGRA